MSRKITDYPESARDAILKAIKATMAMCDLSIAEHTTYVELMRHATKVLIAHRDLFVSIAKVVCDRISQRMEQYVQVQAPKN